MRQALGVIFGLLIAIAGTEPAAAQKVAEPGVVIELYTSQGCSSCPPADDFLGKLSRTPSVIALALHVDYWDYIGWKDKFASPEYTNRQKAYAVASGSGTIYTPQMIVDGNNKIAGVREMDVVELIHEHNAKPSPVTIKMVRGDDKVHIEAQSKAPFGHNASVQLVRYKPEATVSILAGENAGRKMVYHNIVQGWKTLGSWDGSGVYAADAKVEGDDPLVVIVQDSGPGSIIAAAQLR